MNHPFVKDEIIADKVQENVQQGIPAATSEVAEGFFIHDGTKRGIKIVNDIFENLYQTEVTKITNQLNIYR